MPSKSTPPAKKTVTTKTVSPAPNAPPPSTAEMTGGQKIRQRAAESTGPQSEADKVIASKGAKPDGE